jgi:hypothetical protein
MHLGRPSKTGALAILGLWCKDLMGGLLEEASEPKEQAVQKQEANREIADRIKESNILLKV